MWQSLRTLPYLESGNPGQRSNSRILAFRIDSSPCSDSDIYQRACLPQPHHFPGPPPLPTKKSMLPLPTRFFFFFLLFFSAVSAANFTQCLEDFKNEPNAIGGVDSRGHPTSPAAAVGLTYETCTARCGGDAGSFEWEEFAQLFSSWLLPWLALLSQLPFGSGNYADDFVSG